MYFKKVEEAFKVEGVAAQVEGAEKAELGTPSDVSAFTWS
jgi:hypothetical protein